MALMRLDRGDRRTLWVFTQRRGDTAPSIHLAVVPGGGDWVADDWTPVDATDPDDDDELAAQLTATYGDDPDVWPWAYGLILAYGATDDFPNAHPAGTIVITGPVQVLMRPPSGTDIDVQEVAWVVPR